MPSQLAVIGMRALLGIFMCLLSGLGQFFPACSWHDTKPFKALDLPSGTAGLGFKELDLQAAAGVPEDIAVTTLVAAIAAVAVAAEAAATALGFSETAGVVMNNSSSMHDITRGSTNVGVE